MINKFVQRKTRTTNNGSGKCNGRGTAYRSGNGFGSECGRGTGYDYCNSYDGYGHGRSAHKGYDDLSTTKNYNIFF